MERSPFLNNNKEVLFLVIMYFVGIVGHLIPSTRNLMITLTPFTLLLTGGVVTYKSFLPSDHKFLFWGITTYLITFLLEVIGVKTGLVFGGYNYGPALGFKVFEVPLIIGFNWVLVILGAISIGKSYSKNIILISLSTAVLSVMFDYFLEPVAINLGYWQWDQISVPLQNYLAWFLIAFIFSIVLLKIKPDFKPGVSKEYFLIQFTFFIILNLFMR
ncbi:MAG: carotenoid biosynthesis protein [Ignavibacterium sp.]|nr:carotenoid biosynthesis protein [Ignavibacterium sp.]